VGVEKSGKGWSDFKNSNGFGILDPKNLMENEKKAAGMNIGPDSTETPEISWGETFLSGGREMSSPPGGNISSGGRNCKGETLFRDTGTCFRLLQAAVQCVQCQ